MRTKERSSTPMRHEVDQPHRAGGGGEKRLQNQAVAAIAPGRAERRAFLSLYGRRDQPAAMFRGAQKGGEAGIRIETRHAQPVDRAVAADQRRGAAIADHGIIFDAHHAQRPARRSRGPTSQITSPWGLSRPAGKRLIASPRPRQRIALGDARNQEQDQPAGFQRGISKRKTRLRRGPAAPPPPSAALVQHRLAGDQRGGMAVIAQPQQLQIEQRHARTSECLRHIAGAASLHSARGLLRRAVGGHGEDTARRDIAAGKQCLADHAVIAVGIIGRHETFVAEDRSRPASQGNWCRWAR